MRLIITRPAAQAAPWLSWLAQAGVDAVSLPLIEIDAAPDAQALRHAWDSLPGLAFTMFVSANAVQHFFAARSPGSAWPASLQAGCTGPGTAAALRAAGLDEAQVVAPQAGAGRFDSEALWALIGARDWRGTEVLVVRGEEGRDWLAERWGEAGALVHFVAAYRRVAPALDAQGRALLEEALARPGGHLWHFSSGEAIQHLAALAPAADWSTASALVTHERIDTVARRLGFGRVIQVGAGAEEARRGLLQASSDPPSVQSGVS